MKFLNIESLFSLLTIEHELYLLLWFCRIIFCTKAYCSIPSPLLNIIIQSDHSLETFFEFKLLQDPIVHAWLKLHDTYHLNRLKDNGIFPFQNNSMNLLAENLPDWNFYAFLRYKMYQTHFIGKKYTQRDFKSLALFLAIITWDSGNSSWLFLWFPTKTQKRKLW